MNNCEHYFINDICARCGKMRALFGSRERMPKPGDAHPVEKHARGVSNDY